MDANRIRSLGARITSWTETLKAEDAGFGYGGESAPRLDLISGGHFGYHPLRGITTSRFESRSIGTLAAFSITSTLPHFASYLVWRHRFLSEYLPSSRPLSRSLPPPLSVRNTKTELAKTCVFDRSIKFTQHFKCRLLHHPSIDRVSSWTFVRCEAGPEHHLHIDGLLASLKVIDCW